MSENSSKYLRAVDGLNAVLAAFPVSSWTSKTPCSDWTATQLAGHLVGGSQLISIVDTGIAPEESVDAAAGSDPGGNYAKARDLAIASLTEANLAKNVPSPMGEIPLDQVLGMFLTGDVLIHTWDLARAAGQDVTLDAELVQEAYDRLLPLDAMIRMPGIFGPRVEAPAGASMQTKLLCFTGRSAT